jgi:hypothetical protein
MRKFVGYFLAALAGALIGSSLPALHAQGGYSPELREIQLNGVKVTPKHGVINVQIQGGGIIAFGGSDGTVNIMAAPPK